MAIRPPREDLYRELGVERAATADEINAAFRRLAKELHPDARSADPAATEEFKRVSRAYAVLRDPAERARYDATYLDPAEPGTAAPPLVTVVRTSAPRPTPRPPVARRWQFSRRGARRAVGGGVALIVLGLLAGAWIVTLQRHDADLRARGVGVRAQVVEVDGRRRLAFTTASGETVVASESTKTGSQAPLLGSTVAVHYDRADPTRIVVDGSHLARDVTLWIVAVKFVVGGLLLVWFGARRLRRGVSKPAAPAAPPGPAPRAAAVS